jgi:hypothetical protein
VPPPVYEESPPTLPPAEALNRLDQKIFSALAQLGITGADLRMRVEAGHPVELTRIMVNLPKKQSAPQVAGKLAPLLSGDNVILVKKDVAGGVDLDLSLNGMPTHRLSLLSSGPPGKKPHRAPPPKTKPATGALAALVIDDLGYRLGAVKRLLALDLPITFSILPHAPYGAKASALIRRHGREVLLHLPMEPRSYPRLDPGPGALLQGMGRDELMSITRRDLETVPGASGVNNHMGSRLTEDFAAMSAVMEVLAQRGLFFLDSQTSPDSVAYQAARQAGVPTARRLVFLDHDSNLAAVRGQMDRVLSLARRGVPVIAIGHPNDSTLKVLEEYAPRLKMELRLTTVAQLSEASALANGPAGTETKPIASESDAQELRARMPTNGE